MKLFWSLTLFALASPAARADILYINFNVATAEIAAVKAAAAKLGERVEIYPKVPGPLERKIDSLYESTQKAEEEWAKCARTSGVCDSLLKQVSEMQAALEKLTSQVPTLDAEFFTKILATAEANGEVFPTVIISGHSDGHGTFGGSYGMLPVQDLEKAFATAPRLRARVESFLLWGCYSGTLNSLENFWRKNFPQAQLFSGYEDRAPLGIRDVSGIYLEGFLLQQRELLRASSLAEAHAIFRRIPEVADLQGAAIVHDWYMTYDQAASVEQMMKRCDSFDPKLVARFRCYDQGDPGCENPPASHEGELRTLYNFLQKNGQCLPALQQKYPELPSPEYLIRLIFADNIKRNFAQRYSAFFGDFAGALARQGFPAESGLESFAKGTHAQGIARRRAVGVDPRAIAFRDGSLLQQPSWPKVIPILQVYDGVFNLLQLAGSYKVYCTPFSWVDPGAKEKDFCGIAPFLPTDPLSEEGEQEAIAEYVYKAADAFPVPQVQFLPVGSIAGMKEELLAFLDGRISEIRALKDPTDLEATRLKGFEALKAKLSALAMHDLAAWLLATVREHEALLAELRQTVTAFEHNQKALAVLGFWEGFDKKLEDALSGNQT